MTDVPARPRPAAAVATAAVVLATAGCAAPVTVPVAPDAADPVCAEVVLALPDEVAGLERRTTSSQGTAAWGPTDAPLVLRCGVEPPPPSQEQCVEVDDGTTSVDWLAVPASEGAPWTFTTYGRDPAVEVLVPAEVEGAAAGSFLVELGPAVAVVEQTRRCLALDDVG